MKRLRESLSRREALLVAAALVLPIPILAQTGLGVTLPGPVERRSGSIVTLDNDDQRSGTQTTGRTAVQSGTDRQSGRGSLRIGRRGGLTTLPENENPETAGDGGGDGFDRPAGDSGSGSGAPPGADPEGAGDSGGAGSPGDSEEADSPDAGTGGSGTQDTGGSGTAAGESGPEAALLSVFANGGGSSADASGGNGGAIVSLGADGGGADADDAGAGVDVTNEDGSTTSVGTTVPGTGGSAP